jgi:hypothetical protein
MLMKEDNIQYLSFLEGVTLLAWNIAWLCKSQGMSGFDIEQDIYPVGKNLWNLMLAEKPNIPADTTEFTDQEVVSKKPPPDNFPSRFGLLSHGTAHSFFGSVDGQEIMRNWSLKSPKSSMAKVRGLITHELRKAEWEVVEEADLRLIDEEEAVFVGGERYDPDHEQKASAKDSSTKPRLTQAESGSRGINSAVRSAGRPSSNDAAKGPPASGKSGWMMLRTRS